MQGRHRTYSIIAAFAGFFGLAVSAPSTAVELCHIANAGFLIKGQAASVLIDGLMHEDQYDGRFALPSDDMFGDIINKTGLFDNLRLVLSTHRHGDHFDPRATVQHLRATDDVLFAVPEDALPALKANTLTGDEQGRVVLVPDGPQSQFEYGGILVQTYDVDHGPNMPQNVGYRVTVDGVSFFHTGDMSARREQLSAAGVNALPVDVLMLPFWYGMQDTAQQQSIKESWSAARIVPTHFNPRPQAWMNRYGGLEGVKKIINETHDNPLISTIEGECTQIAPSQ